MQKHTEDCEWSSTSHAITQQWPDFKEGLPRTHSDFSLRLLFYINIPVGFFLVIVSSIIVMYISSFFNIFIGV